MTKKKQKKDDAEFYFTFHFGKKKRSIWDWVKLGFALDVGITVASYLPGMNRQKVFHLIDEVQRDRDWEFLNEYIVSDPEFLRYRIEKDIDLAIERLNDD